MIRSASKMNKWRIIRIRELEQTQSISGFVKKCNSLSETTYHLIRLHQVSVDPPTT